jgi:hypothetical protein
MCNDAERKHQPATGLLNPGALVGVPVTVALTLILTMNAFAQTGVSPGFTELPCPASKYYEPSSFRRIISGENYRKTLTIQGPEWNDTLIQGCTIKDVDGDGIVVRDVNRLVIAGCHIENVSGSGIRLSSTGSSSGVILDGNEIASVGENGISVAQRSSSGIDHSALKVVNNKITNSGTRSSSGLTHGIYVQAQDFLIEGNLVSGQRDGNGISVRSSGTVRCNRVEGTSVVNKPGIRYFSDHQTGPSKRLLIEKNDIASEGVGIDLAPPVPKKDEPMSLDHVVTGFVIRDNKVRAKTTINLAPRYHTPPFSVEITEVTTQ